MRDNENSKKANSNKMNENEAFINKFLLDELDQIKNT